MREGLKPGDVALLARDIEPYRNDIYQIAEEFGLPVTVSGGLPVRENPAVAALMSLLNLWTPQRENRFPYREVIAAWRSPYFQWQWQIEKPDGEVESLAIGPEDADALDALARQARVVSGAAAWWDALRRRSRWQPQESDDFRNRDEDDVVWGEDARVLWRKWICFRRSVKPPAGRRSIADFVRWLENLIGPEPDDEPESGDAVGFTLNMVARIRAVSDPVLVERDIAALLALKETLRGMLWAAEALGDSRQITFREFIEDLGGALDATRYEPLRRPGRQMLLAGGIHALAGLRFRAVALVGLAEGAFPAVLQEDPFFRDDDRRPFRQAGWQIAPSPRKEEAMLLYLALSRASHRVLITRPRLAEEGAPWEPSPYWRWLQNATGLNPTRLTHEDALRDFPAASQAELMIALSQHGAVFEEAGLSDVVGAARMARWEHGRRVARDRYRHRATPHNGRLDSLAARLTRRFGSDHLWSVGRLEDYNKCPHFFFAKHILKLEERAEPALGLDSRQLGLFYHDALERLFRENAHLADDPEALKAAWEAMADELLDEASQRYGFRPTAWWGQTREHMKAVIGRTVEALAKESSGWRPVQFEAAFGYFNTPALALSHPDAGRGETLRLRGFIDRIDWQDQDGDRVIRIIDYKTGGVENMHKRALERGEILQLPLYGLAAEEALEQGGVVDGFYWSVKQAKKSPLQLAKAGVETAVEHAKRHAWGAVEGVRAGDFQPRPPAGGCPGHCPAAAYCWQHRPARR